jgi:enoyl-CoA hydratase/carnithine racemase/predicted thioesterase
MKPGLTTGAAGQWTQMVDASSAIHLGAGTSQGTVVFSTPAMILLMETAAREALRPFLDPGEESVGVTVDVRHLAATPLGVQVTGAATVTAVEGRMVDFEVVARDGHEEIGRGTHRRAIISLDRLTDRLREKCHQLGDSAMSRLDPVPNRGALPALSTLNVGVKRETATVTLNRPQKLNAVNRQMTADWEQLNAWLAGHPEVRFVVVTGAGTAFCAGDDVPEVGGLSLEEARQLSLRQARMYLAWERLPQVFIAAINGVAYGAGCVAACSCDLRVASLTARLAMPEVRLGWPPGYGLAQLTALVGKAKALELCLTGEPLSAREAWECGLVHQIVPLGRLSAAVEALVTQLTALPGEALSDTKRLIHLDEGLPAKFAHLQDTEAYIRCLETPNAREGIAAFAGKRPPRFNN